MMKLLFDVENKVNYDKINKNTTVKDVLDAVDIFLNNNSLNCNECEESCCKKSWSVEMDNICVNRLSSWNDKAALDFIQEKVNDRYLLDKSKQLIIFE